MRVIALLFILVPLACRFHSDTSRASACFDLGDALLKTHKYPEAAKALEEAERLHYTPLADVLAALAEANCHYIPDTAQADSLRNIYDSIALQNMQAALLMGYTYPENFLRDTVFLPLRRVPNFHAVYASVMSGRNDPKTAHWKEFKEAFPQTPLPLLLDTQTQATGSVNGDINPDFVDFIPAIRTRRFSRMMDETFFYVAKIQETPLYLAVIYLDALGEGANPFVGNERPSNTLVSICSNCVYYLVTYSPAGKMIDQMAVAGHRSWDDPLQSFSMSPSMHFVVEDLHFRLRKNNGQLRILGAITQNVRHFRIDEQGKFERLNAPVMARSTPSPALSALDRYLASKP